MMIYGVTESKELYGYKMRIDEHGEYNIEATNLFPLHKFDINFK